MTQFLPPNLLALFAPRDPIPYLPPATKLPWEKTSQPYAGIGAFVKYFEDSKDAPAPTRTETKDERNERKRRERAEQVAYKLEQDLALWDPTNDPNIYGDPFKTLFIARINYDSSESKLRREFESYGPVNKVHVAVNRRTGKPRGYAFIEFEHERDMHTAYKHADGKKIDGRRVLVDVERGRTVKGWRPRRLGGGLGGTRKGGTEENTKYSGRDDFVGRDRNIPDDRKGLDGPDRRRPTSRNRSMERDRRPPRRRSRSPRRPRSRERHRSDEKDIVVKQEPGAEGEDPNAARRRGRRSRSRERGRRSRSPRDRKPRIGRSRSRERRRSRDHREGGAVNEKMMGAGALIAAGMTVPGMEGANGAMYVKREANDYGEYQGGADTVEPGVAPPPPPPDNNAAYSAYQDI